MGIKTDIEWSDSSLNLEMGCQGCELWNPKSGVRRCYAGNLTERYAGLKGWPASFDQPAIFPERLKEALRWPDLTGKDRPDKPWLNGYPRTIFLNDMGDTWTESLDLMWLAPFVRPMAESPHVYIILTKRPARMAKFWWEYLHMDTGEGIPPNFWLLTSVTGPENGGRILELLKMRALGARVLGVSYEPALGPVDFKPLLQLESHPGGPEPRPDGSGWRSYWRGVGLDWLIAGGESGAGAKPSHPDWFRAARDACQVAGVAFFFKQWGEWSPFTESGLHGDRLSRVGKKAAGAMLDGREWREMPEAQIVREASETVRVQTEAECRSH